MSNITEEKNPFNFTFINTRGINWLLFLIES